MHSPTLLNGFLQNQNRHHRREVPVDKSEWHKNMTAYIRADVILVQLHYCRLHTFSHSKIYFSLLLKFSTSRSSTLQFLSVLAVYFQLQNGKYTSSILQFYKLEIMTVQYITLNNDSTVHHTAILQLDMNKNSV
jgi:hypothetical protein